MSHTTSLGELEIFEKAEFEQAGIKLLSLCLELLKDHQIVLLPNSNGIARLVNLLHWDVSQNLEYVDGEGVYADQVVHFAVHHVMARHEACHNPKGMLFAECLASAADAYLAGKLSQAGLESDFLHDTLESFGSYYDMYTEDEGQMERQLAALLANPFEAMTALATYLYQFGSALLAPQPDFEALNRLQAHMSYPLAHHYNISNWILTIRAAYPGQNEAGDPKELMALFCRSEAGFLDQFKSA